MSSFECSSSPSSPTSFEGVLVILSEVQGELVGSSGPIDLAS